MYDRYRTITLVASMGAIVSCADEEASSEGFVDDVEFRSSPATDDPLPQDRLDEIAAVLVDSVDATIAHPELFPEEFDPNPEIVEPDTDVWVTFVSEGASYRNALGYFTFPSGSPPSELTVEELEDGLIFENSSAQGSGGTLYNGSRVYLGTFQPGVRIGFFIVANGHCDDPGMGSCSAAGVDFTKPVYTTVDSMNVEYGVDPDKARHVVLASLIGNPTEDAHLLAFEDLDRLSNSDDDFTDVIFRVTAEPALVIDDEPVIGTTCGGDGDLFGIRGAAGGYAFSYCWPNLGEGQFGEPVTQHLSDGDYSGYTFRVADVDNDGVSDVCGIRGASGGYAFSRCWPGNGDGTFGAPYGDALSEWTGNYIGYTFQVADIDNDGNQDICGIRGRNGGYAHSYCWPGNGDGSFGEPYSDALSNGQGNYIGYTFMVADVDNDGNQDICGIRGASGGYAHSYCWPGNGDGSFGEPYSDALSNGQGNYIGYTFQIADVDNDGNQDVCGIRGRNGGYAHSYCWPGNGDGTFGDAYSDALSNGQGNYVGYTFQVVDIDHDGNQDVCGIRGEAGGYAHSYCWPGLGDGTFGDVMSDAVSNGQGNFIGYSFRIVE